MKQPSVLRSLRATNKSQSFALFTTRLTGEQVAALSRCANGISLRFDASEIVDALVAVGYARKNVAGVVSVTPEGRRYLEMHQG